MNPLRQRVRKTRRLRDIFRQTRIGQCRRFNRWRRRGTAERRKSDLNGEPFSFDNSRTIYIDARERWPELYEYDYTPEETRTMRFKLTEDQRLTGMGEFLRRYTLDELPNFLNVLNRNMTLIGPRGERIVDLSGSAWQRRQYCQESIPEAGSQDIADHNLIRPFRLPTPHSQASPRQIRLVSNQVGACRVGIMLTVSFSG